MDHKALILAAVLAAGCTPAELQKFEAGRVKAAEACGQAQAALTKAEAAAEKVCAVVADIPADMIKGSEEAKAACLQRESLTLARTNVVYLCGLVE